MAPVFTSEWLSPVIVSHSYNDVIYTHVKQNQLIASHLI